MKKAVVAAVAGLMIVSSGAVYAQYHRHHRFSQEDKSAFVDARIAAVHAGLHLTADQEKNWPAVESAVRDFAKQRIDRAQARMSERDERRAERDRGPDAQNNPPEADPVARLRDRADNLAATAASLKKIADAADPLYRSLDDGQKRRLMVLTQFGHRGGWRHHFDREFDQDGPRGRHFDGPAHRPEHGPDSAPERL